MHMYERCYLVTRDVFYTSRSTGRLRRKTCLDAIGEIAMFPVTSRTGQEGLFISVVGKNTTWLNVSY